MAGGFCFQCGQSGKDFNVPVGEFAKDFASETLSLDSRLRITLKRLFLKAGAVPKEYVAGHRARFVPPVRLYVFASFTMFLVMALGPTRAQITPPSSSKVATDSTLATADSTLALTDSTQVGTALETATIEADTIPEFLSDLLEGRLKDGMTRANEDLEGFMQDVRTRLAQAMFFLLPAFAGILKLVYPRRLYVHHLVFSVYHHCFVFLLMSVVFAATALGSAIGMENVTDVVGFAVFWIPVYLFLGMRRFYEQTRVRTTLKFIGVSVVYMVLALVTVLTMLLISLVTF